MALFLAPDVEITFCNTNVILVMKDSHTASNARILTTPRESGHQTWSGWRLRVAIGLAIATFAGALSLATTASPVDAAGPEQIVIRAAGSTGEEEMLLKVNGVETARWRVAKGEQAYEHAVEKPLEVTSVEVAFLNDNGPRDLNVKHVNLGGVVLKSTAPGTISSGTWDSSSSSCLTRAATSSVLHCNGSFTYEVPAGTVLGRVVDSGPVVNVRAIGKSGGEQLNLIVNGEKVASATMTTKWQIVTANLPEGTAVKTAEVAFVNDRGSLDLRVDYLEVDGRRFQSESSETLNSGTYSAGRCQPAQPSGSEWLRCSGSFTYKVGAAPLAVETPSAAVVDVATAPAEAPKAEVATARTAPPAPTTTAPPTTTTTTTVPAGDQIAVRALGSSGSEIMQLRVNGRVINSWTVSGSWKTYSAAIADADAVTKVEVQFVNDGRNRDLRVDYIELDGDRYQSEASTTRNKGTYTQGSCSTERSSSSEWLHCSGWFSYPVSGAPAAAPQPTVQTSSRTATSPAQSQSVTPARSSNGRYSIAQVINGTIGAGDGGNPNEESPMGRHEAPIYLPQGWNWAQGPSRNSVWGQLGSGGSRYAEFRCAVIPEFGHRPSVPFRINVRNGAYYQFVNNSWRKGFDVDLTGGNHGGYLGQAGRVNNDPFSSGSHGQIQWRRESDGSFSAPWNANALMMHFWAGQRKAPASGQTAEFLTSEVRLQQPDGRRVDLSQVKVLFQCGVDYYNTTGGQGTKVPGPGIAKYSRATTEWRPGLWVTLPRNAPANSVSDFRNWLQRNTPPNVS